MAGVLYPRQAPVDLGTYRSSYTVTFRPFGKHKYSRVTPEEQVKVYTQLREKELYTYIPSPNPKLEDGYPAFGRPYMDAKDLGSPGFFPPVDRESAAGAICSSPSFRSTPHPVSHVLYLAEDDPNRVRRSAAFPCLLELQRQPAAQEGDGYLLVPGCLCARHQTAKVPILSRWGPAQPFYQ